MMTGAPVVQRTKCRMSARLTTTMSPLRPMPQSSHTATIALSSVNLSSLSWCPPPPGGGVGSASPYTAMGMFLTCGPCS